MRGQSAFSYNSFSGIGSVILDSVGMLGQLLSHGSQHWAFFGALRRHSEARASCEQYLSVGVGIVNKVLTFEVRNLVQG